MSRWLDSIPIRKLSHAPDVREFLFAGTYNGWNPQALPVHSLSGEEWAAEIELIPDAYQYKLLMDGRWCCKAV